MPLTIFLQSREEAMMPQKIGGGCSSQEYDSPTCDSVKIGGIVTDKLVSLFHIPSKSHTVRLDKIQFSRGKIRASDKLIKYGVLPA